LKSERKKRNIFQLQRPEGKLKQFQRKRLTPMRRKGGKRTPTMTVTKMGRGGEKKGVKGGKGPGIGRNVYLFP